MRSINLVTMFVGLLGLTNPAQADECADPPNQLAMNECSGKAFEEADRKLNDTYQHIMSRVGDDAATKKLLVDAQRAWIAFRDAECMVRSSRGAGGSIYPLLVTTCRRFLTEDRLKDLQRYLNCQEDDFELPCISGGMRHVLD